jgi:hypothetical protein
MKKSAIALFIASLLLSFIPVVHAQNADTAGVTFSSAPNGPAAAPKLKKGQRQILW